MTFSLLIATIGKYSYNFVYKYLLVIKYGGDYFYVIPGMNVVDRKNFAASCAVKHFHKAPTLSDTWNPVFVSNTTYEIMFSLKSNRPSAFNMATCATPTAKCS